jgi:hypothetical protein
LDSSNDLTNPNTTMVFQAGLCRDDSDKYVISLLTGMAKNFNAAWVAGSGNGAMDVGATLPVSSWVHVFAIKNLTTGASDIIGSGSISNPTLPGGWTAKRRIRSFLTDASAHIIPDVQVGDDFNFKTPILNLNTQNNGGAINYYRAVSTPLGLKLKAILSYVAANTSAVGSTFLAVADPDLGALSLSHQIDCHTDTVQVGGVVACFTDTSSQVASFDSNPSAGGAKLSLWTRGYIDKRGR